MSADDTNDTFKASVAELIGKKAEDLKPEVTGTLVRSWQTYLAGEGYELKSRPGTVKPPGRHIVVYSDVRGNTQAVLSDSEEAARVTPLVRLSVTKAAKAGSDQKGA